MNKKMKTNLALAGGGALLYYLGSSRKLPASQAINTGAVVAGTGAALYGLYKISPLWGPLAGLAALVAYDHYVKPSGHTVTGFMTGAEPQAEQEWAQLNPSCGAGYWWDAQRRMCMPIVPAPPVVQGEYAWQ